MPTTYEILISLCSQRQTESLLLWSHVHWRVLPKPRPWPSVTLAAVQSEIWVSQVTPLHAEVSTPLIWSISFSPGPLSPLSLEAFSLSTASLWNFSVLLYTKTWGSPEDTASPRTFQEKAIFAWTPSTLVSRSLLLPAYLFFMLFEKPLLLWSTHYPALTSLIPTYPI